VKNSQSDNKTAGFKKLLAEYDALVERIVSILREPKSPTHFSDLRQMIDELEMLEQQLTSSNLMRKNIDVPES
jgi:hypothetical protein